MLSLGKPGSFWLLSKDFLYESTIISKLQSFIKKKVCVAMRTRGEHGGAAWPSHTAGVTRGLPCVTQQTTVQSTLGYDVTESGVQLPTAQNPITRQGWWKVCFILDASNCGGGTCWGEANSRGRLVPTNSQGARAFIDREGGYMPALETVAAYVTAAAWSSCS